MSEWLWCPDNIVLGSTVEPRMRPIVETLFFFNPRQPMCMNGIQEAVRRFGVPEIIERDGLVSLTVRDRSVQCLFACDRNKSSRPVGVILYVRTSTEVMSIAHLAVQPEYAAPAGKNGSDLGLILVEAIRRIAHQINGIQRLELPYQRDRFLRVAQIPKINPLSCSPATAGEKLESRRHDYNLGN